MKFREKLSTEQQKKLEQLKKKQQKLAREAREEDRYQFSSVAGFDLSFFDKKAFCAAVVTRYPSPEILEKRVCKSSLKFPYIPTFLSLREAPAIKKTYSKLDQKPDLLLFDGNGKLHPRRCGIATQLGIELSKPAIGIAKSLLCGNYEKPIDEGDSKQVIDDGEVIGAALKSKAECRPIFISIGHLITLSTAIKVSKRLLNEQKLPIPLQKAHLLAEKKKQEA